MPRAQEAQERRRNECASVPEGNTLEVRARQDAVSDQGCTYAVGAGYQYFEEFIGAQIFNVG